MTYLLNIGYFMGQSRANGPGNRSVIWTQGCARNCPSCFNQKFQRNVPAYQYSIHELFNKIIQYRSDISGVTFSGGEPFDQAEGLFHLSVLLKAQGLNIMSYSGYTYKELKNGSGHFWQEFLGELDILIDGPYMEEMKDLSMWKGSTNQKVYFFDETLLVGKEETESKFEIIIEKDDRLFITGTFDEEIADAFYGCF